MRRVAPTSLEAAVTQPAASLMPTALSQLPGGGNETSAAAAAAPPPRGAVPTFTVDSLAHLQRRLEARDTSLGWGAYGSATLALSSSDSEDASGGDGVASLAGAPPEGLDFLDALFSLGAVQASAARARRAGGGRAAGLPERGVTRRLPAELRPCRRRHRRALPAHLTAAVTACAAPRRPRAAPFHASTAHGLACPPMRTRATECCTWPAATAP